LGKSDRLAHGDRGSMRIVDTALWLFSAAPYFRGASLQAAPTRSLVSTTVNVLL
jgi:hypothetical protein